MARVYDGTVLDSNLSPLTDHQGDPITDGTVIITDVQAVSFSKRSIPSSFSKRSVGALSFDQRSINATIFE